MTQEYFQYFSEFAKRYTSLTISIVLGLWCAGAGVVEFTPIHFHHPDLAKVEILWSLVTAFEFWQSIRSRQPSQKQRHIKFRPNTFTLPIAIFPWFAASHYLGFFSDGTYAGLGLMAHLFAAPLIFRRMRQMRKEHLMPKRLAIFYILVAIAFSLHVLALIWLTLKFDNEPIVDPVSTYVSSIYFVMTTLTTVGYGDIVPDSNVTRLFAVALQFTGVCIFGVVIGQVSRLLVNADRRREIAQKRMENLVALFQHYDIPVALRQKTFKFYQHLLDRTSNEEEQEILNILPKGLQEEIRVHMNARPLARVPLFRNCNKTCLIDAARELTQNFYTPGQPIIRRGEVGDAMFMIGHGEVKVHNGDHFIAHLSDGACFGEMALVEAEVRTADVSALTHCDIFVLSKEKFDSLLKNHKDLQQNVTALIQSRRSTAQKSA